MNWSYIVEKNAKEHPDKEAIIFGDHRITYEQLNERVNALAKGLLDLGLGKGDIVAILLLNCLEYMELTFAVNKIGAVWLPLNFRLAGEELLYILNNSESKALVSEMDFSETIANIKDRALTVKHCIGIGKTMPEGWHSYDNLVEKNLGSKVPDTEVEMDDLERLMYTSGTTAYPKGVMITYSNLYWKNMQHIVMCKLVPEEKCLVAGPFYHVGGMDLCATAVLQLGGTIFIQRRFNSVQALEMIEREKITQIWAAPAMINILLREPTLKNYNLNSVRLVIDGGEKMPLPLITRFIEAFPNAWFSDAYGLTETVSGDTFLEKECMIKKLGSVGRPVPVHRIKIVDDNDNDVPPGTLGEIVHKGPKVFKGYWKNEEATAEVMKDGWFHSGDIGYLDEEGYLYIEDRKKDIIVSGGENVSSAEVERIIYELPQVSEVAVVGIPHPRWLEVPKAYVALKEGQKLSEQDIVEQCTKKLAKFKVPKEVEFIPQLPRNPSGKVLKRELRERARKQQQQ